MHEFDHNGYGRKESKCLKCGKQITITSEWLANVEESVVMYDCPHCGDNGWYYF